MKVNIHYLIFIIISIIAMLIDYLVYLFNINYLVSLIISCIVIIPLSIVFIKKLKIKINTDFEIYDLIFYAILINMILFNIPYVDNSYDVNNYHIYLQNCFNIDKINFDFIPGSIRNTYLFALGDRMHYIFRYLLGYRLGTIFSYYVNVVIFYQVKKILKLFITDNKSNNFIISLLSSSFMFIEIINMWIGSYYIDIMGIIIPLQILYIFLSKENIFNNKFYIFYIFFISGIATAIKISNIIIIVPIILFYFIKYIKSFKWKNIIYYLLALIIYFIPFILYMIDSYKQTGSPLFPYYNNIFKSKFFDLYSWRDGRFFIPSINKFFIWSYYVSLIQLGYGDNFFFYDYVWAYGYIITILYIVINIIKRIFKKIINNKENELLFITIILTFTWEIFMYGYMRYAQIVGVLYCICSILLIIKIWNCKKVNKIILKIKNFKIIKYFTKISFLSIASNFIFLLAIVCNIYTIFFNSYAFESYTYILKDRTNKDLNLDAPLATINDYNRIAALIREDGTPIINLRIDDTYNDEIDKQLNKQLDKYDYLYLPVTTVRLESTIASLEERKINYTIYKEYTIDDIPYINVGDTITILKVSKKEL